MHKPLIKKGKKFVEVSEKEAKELVKKHLKGLAIVLSPEITNEEAKAIKKLADQKGLKIGAFFDKGLSTTKLAKIFTSKKIQLDAKVKDYPLLKPFIHIAKKQGAEITKKDPDIAIVEAPTAPKENLPTIVLHKGLNEVGLMELGFSQPPKAKSYLLIGPTEKKLDGYVISVGMNKQADLILPIPKWINREGTIITSEKRELQVNKVFDGPQIVDIIKSYL
jgi:hypothetical protein